MLEKIKNIILKTDHFLYKKFGSHKSTKILENIKEAKVIFSCLKQSEAETEVRFVGGCVRKAIFGENIDDIDLATTLTPDTVKSRLKKENIKVIDTGIDHGTITAILKDKKFEITTLRKDVLTDGRHAKIIFTTDWKEDASRRDFTINAIYSDIEGRVFDPLDGMPDLINGKIKFIGDQDKRIQEDYLRILRYFRFFAGYSKTDHDQKTINSIKKNINGINKISNERIFDELKKILALENLFILFSNKVSCEILLNIFPQFKFYERLKEINVLSEKLKKRYDINLILALLVLDDSKEYEYFCHKYKTSNEIKDRFRNISINFEDFKNKKFYSEENIKRLIYLSGKNKVRDLILFSVCLNKKNKISHIESLIDYIDNCEIPKFPISGDYLKKHGYETGLMLGKKLKSLEEQWIKNNFAIDKKVIEKSLNKSSKS